MIAWLRLIAAGILFGLAIYWLWTAVKDGRRRRRPLYGVEADTGRPTGLRVSPLSPAESAAALALERDAAGSWDLTGLCIV